MGDYLIVSRLTDAPVDAALAGELRRLAEGAGLTHRPLNRRTDLMVAGPCPPEVRSIGAWTLVGEVFHRSRPDLSGPSAGALDYERRMFARFWGRYVGLRSGRDDLPDALMRDPSGALECIAWRHDGLLIVASHAFPWLLERLRPPWRINLARLARALHDPLGGAGPLLLDGPIAVLPGAVQPIPLDHPAQQVWRPSTFARQSLSGDAVDPAAAAARLTAALDETVQALAALPGPLAAEVSGGLDSSVVAACLVKAEQHPVQLWLNAVGADPEADERPWAEALGRYLGFTPVSVPHAGGPITVADLEDASSDFRPGLNGLDRPHDADWVRRCRDAGVQALMTGKGGDSILLQRANGDVFTDLWLRQGWRALRHPDVFELARANEASIWTLVAQARRQHTAGPLRPRREHPLLAAPPAAPDPHPWMEDLEGFGPAKALHIAGVVDSVSRHGGSVLTAAIDVRHPLCAQPVIETCLALPADILTIGGRDRGLVRRAFKGRLPALILERRTKGDMTRIYGRRVLDNLAVLRPWLIEGRLAALGLIDPEAADRELTRETLLWRGRYSTIAVSAAFEAWVRVWERRLENPGSAPPSAVAQ